MTARDFVPIAAPGTTGSTTPQNASETELNRKRSLFLDFCAEWLLSSSPGQQGSFEDDQVLAELFKNAPAPPAEVINDLPGVLNASAPRPAAGASTLDHLSAAPFDPAAVPDRAGQAPTAAAASAAAAAAGTLHHRAVVTSMPMPPTTRAAAADADDDTSSVKTLPMPSRKRRRGEEEDEACSSPNDLVEVPAAQTTAAARKRQHAAAAAAGSTRHDASSSRDQSTAAGGSNSAAVNAAAAASPDVHKGILVAKVLTKSDANSKRVILPRIAVETNLPQLASAQNFHFSATDPAGKSWHLVIKAWANGSNPKPVYVMEMIGDVLKEYKLTIGDAVALLADQDGHFYLEWNTTAAHAAAGRPTYSGIKFKDLQGNGAAASSTAQQEQQRAAPPAGETAAAVPAATQAHAAAAEAATPRAAVPASSPFASAAAGAPQAAQAPPAAADCAVAIKQEPQEQQQLVAEPGADCPAPPAVVSASQQQQLFQQLPISSNLPLMTAVPVTQPQVPGHFIPTSPCQLLVVGHLPIPDLDLDLDAPAALQPSLPSSLLGNLNSNGDVVLPPPPAAYLGSLEPASASEAEGLLVPTGAGPQLAHSGGVLLCPRTPGCTRPAGHQGWCLGHKGYKKRRA